MRVAAIAAVSALAFSGPSSHGAPADMEDVRIGVYDVRAAGGSGAKVDGLIRGLRGSGYQVDAFASLDLLSLLPFDIVILSDMHNPGRAPEDWRKSIATYVGSGGSILQTWHHHILADISVGVQRVYGRQRMVVRAGHPAMAGISDFDSRFKDHIIEKVGPGGTVVLENDQGEPVAAVGTLGKGKVVSTGLALAIPDGRNTQPARGPEKALLDAFLVWLRPSVRPADRMSALGGKPQLTVSPDTVLTAAGFGIDVTVRVGPVPTGAPVRIAVDGVPVPLGDQGADVLPIRTATIRLTAPAGHASETQRAVTARIGEEDLARTVTVTGVYAPTPANEKRGVWLHVGMDRHPERVMPELKRLGITMAVPRIAGGTAAFYASKVQPDVQDPLAETGGDWLAETVKHAHANGIEIHPYVNNCVVEGRTSPESLERLKQEGRLQQSPEGETIAWFCPSHPENLDAITRPMVEIASTYDIDGIQYDFIRYPNSRGCFCPTCRALFEKETAKAVGAWPVDVLPEGARFDEWVEFRCRRISAIVEHVSGEVRKVNPKARISAAVFSNWPDCRVGNGQDWVRWCREGWLDLVFPMTYTQDAAAYDGLVSAHRQALPEGFPLIEGIGINSGSGKMRDPAALALHVMLARRNGAAGWCGFCYTPEQTATLVAPLTAWLSADIAE